MLLQRLKNVFLFFAIITIGQFFLQYIYKGPDLFSFNGIVPEQFLVDGGFNTLNPLEYASEYFKSNGFFFLEASIAGQFLARGLIIVVSYFTSLLAALILGLALIVTYAGTGFTIVGVFVVFYFFQRSKNIDGIAKILLAIVIAGATVLLIAFGDRIGLGYLTNRVNEFQSDESSGYNRYIAPTQALISSFQDRDVLNILIGLGPGNTDSFRTENIAPFPLISLLFDYGILGAFLYSFLIFQAFSRSFGSPAIRAALIVQMLVVDPSFNVPQTTYISFLIGGLALVEGRFKASG